MLDWKMGGIFAGEYCGVDFSEGHAVVCIRDVIGISERLTLQDFWSEELNDYYNATYRTREEVMEFLKKTFLEKGFHVCEDNFWFDGAELNNRKETAQYYFILER